MPASLIAGRCRAGGLPKSLQQRFRHRHFVCDWAAAVSAVRAGLCWNRLWSVDQFVMPRREIEDYGRGEAAKQICDILAGGAP